MDIKKILAALMQPKHWKHLPKGKDGDGISKEHFLGAQKRLGVEHFPAFIGAQNELEIAKSQFNLMILFLKARKEYQIAEEVEEKYQNLLLAIAKKDKAEQKLHRWLGWFQGVLAAFKIVSLDEMKQLNKNS